MAFKKSRTLALIGPAFVAAVAYVDPGNFAANFSAGARYGDVLLWVLIVANIMASFVQYLSAKVGLVTKQSLPEVVAARLPRMARIAYWLQAEVVAAATDIAEIIGGAIALQLLFGCPLILGGIVTGIASLLLLLIYSKRGQKVFERVIIGLLLVIPVGFIIGLVVAPPRPSDIMGGLLPQIHGQEMLLLAIAMLGATIMPHVIYLHSALARDRHIAISAKQLPEFLRATRMDVIIAMFIAGGVNIAMLLLAASSLPQLHMDITLVSIFGSLANHLGPLVAMLFALGLLVSGFASTAVGSQAGVVIMEGMLHRRFSPFFRRMVVTLPAVLLLLLAIDPTKALIISQIALSFGVPFALVPLVLVTSSKRVMGKFVNTVFVTGVVWGISGVVVALNGALIWLTFS